MDGLTPEQQQRGRALLDAALPSRPQPVPTGVPAPEPVDPRRAAERARIKEYAERIVADWPPLTDEQLAKITAIMRPTLRPSA